MGDNRNELDLHPSKRDPRNVTAAEREGMEHAGRLSLWGEGGYIERGVVALERIAECLSLVTSRERAAAFIERAARDQNDRETRERGDHK